MEVIRSLSDLITVFGQLLRDSIEVQVAASGDDARYDVTWNGFNSTLTQMDTGHKSNGDKYDTVYRFQNVTIPAGAIIVSATISVNVVSDVSDKDFHSKIIGNDVDDAVAPTSAAQYTALALTDAYVEWNLTAWTAGFMASPDIKTIIQEIIDRPGWASGNDLQILWKNNLSAAGSLVNCYTYDQGSTYGAKLNVTYDYIP